MAQHGVGVLPRQMLAQLLAAGVVSGISEKYLQPASIDLPLSTEAFRIESNMLPQHKDQRVRDLIPAIGGTPHDLRNPLEVGVMYLIRIDAMFHFVETIYGYVNPKSSAGRINLFSRVIADGVSLYDAMIPEGWEGEAWVLVRPDSFPVLLSPGQAVSQLRLFDGYTKLDRTEIHLATRAQPLLYAHNGRPVLLSGGQHVDGDGSLYLTIDVEGHELGGFPGMRASGYECRGMQRVLDFGKIAHYPVRDFFSPVVPEQGLLRLRKGSLYILSTAEWVVVPPELSAELRPIDVRLGEFRSHAAGYIDPGWGWGTGELKGRPITLEVIPYEDLTWQKGQIVARLRYERMKYKPDVPYDSGASHYSAQSAARVSKHFKI